MPWPLAAGVVIRKSEWVVAAGTTAILILLHTLFLLNAGALWRDEVSSVNLASLPLEEFWANFQFDSFPVLWYALLRVWIRSGLGSTDFGLRALGWIVGVGVIAALWRNARAFGIRVPLVSLALFGCNAAVLAYGDSVRGYGLGLLTGLVTFSLAWEFANEPGPRRLLLLAFAAVVSVHCLYHNSVLLLAACAGGSVVAAKRKQWSTLAELGGVGMAAGVSLLLYRGTLQNRESWNAILRWSIDFSWIWEKFFEAAMETHPVAPWLWVGLAALALTAVPRLLRPATGLPERERDLVMFSGTALVTGIAANLLFLLKLGYLMQPWYFLSLFALVATCMDGILGVSVSSTSLRVLRAGAVIALVALALPGIWSIVQQRKTNLDLIAARLGQSAAKEDLIIVTPWHCGITFDRYYRGPADWMTVPPLSSHKLPRYDLLKQAMMSPEAMRPVLDRIRSTLLAGHRVWWVGRAGHRARWVGHLAAAPEREPPLLRPAPAAPWGWAEIPHYRGWERQAAFVLRQHARRAVPVPVPSDRPVSRFEKLALTLIEGKDAQVPSG